MTYFRGKSECRSNLRQSHGGLTLTEETRRSHGVLTEARSEVMGNSLGYIRIYSKRIVFPGK